MHFSKVRNETISKESSTFHIPEFWNEIGMWISISHSTFQCTLAGRGMRHSQKRQFHIPHSRILEWIWIVDYHSTFQIPYSKLLEFELESELGIHLHSKFHSIPIPLWLSQTYIKCCSILSSIPIPQWMEWNVKSRLDTGCCLELLFARWRWGGSVGDAKWAGSLSMLAARPTRQ